MNARPILRRTAAQASADARHPVRRRIRSLAPLLLAGLLLGLAACGQADGSAPPPSEFLDGPPPANTAAALPAPAIPDSAPKVAFLGDSITAGLHLPADQAFPDVVQRLLAERGLPTKVVRAGVSGDTSAGGLSRIDWVLRSKPNVVVIELGGNDGLRGKAVGDIAANLRAIVERVRAAGAAPVLVGMQMPGNYGLAYTGAFQRLYEDLAEDLDVSLVPRFMEKVGGRPEFNLPDLLHPNAKGHAVLAEELLPHLQRVLEGLGG